MPAGPDAKHVSDPSSMSVVFVIVIVKHASIFSTFSLVALAAKFGSHSKQPPQRMRGFSPRQTCDCFVILTFTSRTRSFPFVSNLGCNSCRFSRCFSCRFFCFGGVLSITFFLLTHRLLSQLDLHQARTKLEMPKLFSLP